MTLPYDSILTHPTLSPIQETAWWSMGITQPNRDAALLLREPTLADQPWMLIATLLLLLALVATWSGNRQYLHHRIQTFFISSRRFNNTTDISSVAERELLSYSLLFATCISFALLLCPHLSHLQVPLLPLLPISLSNPSHAFLLLLIVSLLFVLIKAVAYTMVNKVFFPHKDNQKWMSAWILLTGLVSIPLFTLVVLQTYTPISSQKVAISALILIILYKIAIYYKLKLNFHIKNYGSLLILLYLCTLEIAPALAIWHFFDTHNTM